jgi:hypothetical protein
VDRVRHGRWSCPGVQAPRGYLRLAPFVSGTRRVIAVQYNKQEVVDVLNRAGLFKAAEEAVRDLPDPVERNYVLEWAATSRGISRDVLINRMGGSP